MKNLKFVCEHCGSEEYERRTTTYPVFIQNRQIDVGRVAVRVCADCQHMFPTKAGQEKINRCIGNMLEFYKSAGVDIYEPQKC